MEIIIDNTVPSSMAHLLERHYDLMLQHGGVCTRIEFDRVEEMTLDAFVRTEVPKLSAQDSRLTVLRNAAAGSYTFILGDRVN